MKAKTILSSITAAVAILAAAPAAASPFVLDTSAFGLVGGVVPGDSDSKTVMLESFNLLWSATSIYTDNKSLFDGVGNPLGHNVLSVGDYVSDSGVGTVSLTGMNGADVVGFSNNEGINNYFSLTFSYSNLLGQVTFIDPADAGGIAAYYGSGLIEVFANLIDVNTDTVTSTQKVMDLNIVGSAGTVGEFTLFAKVASIADGMILINGGNDVNDILALNVVDVDANTVFVNPSELVAEIAGSDPMQWKRTTTLTGNMSFDVPEPGVLGLLGLGFAGLGFARRNKKQV